MCNIFVIHSPSQESVDPEAGYWSNTYGWCGLADASRFTDEDKHLVELPAGLDGDARWVLLPPGQPIYNHAFALAFEVRSPCKDGEAITPKEFQAALLQRIQGLMENPGEWSEALGAPFDTYEESDLAFDYTVGYGEEGPSCPLCSSWVDQPLNIQEADTQPWLGKCRRRGHLGYYALDDDDD